MRLMRDVDARRRSGPDDWPGQVEEVDDDTPDPGDGRLVMTRAEYAAYRAARRAAYEAWAAAQPEAVAERRAAQLERVRARYEDAVAAGYRVPAGEHRGLRFSFSELERVAQVVDLDDALARVTVSTADENAKVELTMPELRHLLRAARAARLELHQQAEAQKDAARGA